MTDAVDPSAYAPRLIPADLVGTVPDLASAPPVRWGVLGAGAIAASFCDGVRERTASSVVAVGSRDLARAEAFAGAHAPGARPYGSYAELVADPDVDVVYVATPHSHHLEHALVAIRAGKHVLVEKPLTRSAAESRVLLDAAREAGVFCMEAMWTRFLPHVAALRSVVARGEIGEVVTVAADFDVLFPYDPSHRLFAPELAGGALLDLGIYPVAFAHDLLGVPSTITATGTLAPTGVDDHVAMLLGYESGAHAVLRTSSRSVGTAAATITGTRGRIEIPEWFFTPTGFRVVRADGSTWTFQGPTGEGKAYEAAEVARRVTAGETQSERVTWQDTLEVMGILDEVRRQLGVVYPGE
ncbi:Gfo/Idh/MocA family protein [Isoptericola variabilis]|uniref:Trans-1,2-dihydrobenzene-1,2-diol dehydrogenase n=1 Tax=Isoptericola variabilis (strain 225) TaxID=743718 RepID=F6FU24_ISOV2|nr:Gfo/Idh/MocA family oxidoreductase [Isoptericola variabilis]AEG43220.1 Trans-1,2-dihydrobenzene-1,2-diol dehydrogenase [Isoptericola variabilis 225]TWH35155.1 putative dehydrogenase [Isoptericola variabilis J7]